MSRVVIKASAGTGKTYRLSLEYIISLLNGVNFEEILVMTFTRKATSEIKEKIFERIEELISDDINLSTSVKNNILKINNEITIDTTSIDKLKTIYEKMIKNKDKVMVYTIDSFTAEIFEKIVSKIVNIDKYSIISSNKNNLILKEVMAEIFEKKSLFEIIRPFLIDNTERNVEKYINFIYDLIENRWLFELINSNKKEKEKFYLDENDLFKEINILCELVKNFINEKNKTSKNKKQFEEIISKKYRNYFFDVDIQNRKESLMINFKEILNSNLWDGRFLKKVDDSIVEQNEIVKDILCKEIYNNIILENEKNILNIMKVIYDIYDQKKIRDREFTFSDVSFYVYKYLFDKNYNLVDENGVTENFYMEMNLKINTIFIDEFQDTSILQWKILYEIIKTTKNVICVGDEKQSIYGWRGGEKKLFENLNNILNCKVENMSISYRSDKNIVSYTNDFFARISSDRRWNFYPSSSNSNEDGFVKVINYDKEYLDTIIKIIENFSKENYNNLAIIARKNKDLKIIADLLSEKSIPYVLNTDIDIREAKGIREMLSILKYLNKGIYIDFLEFLSSKISGINFNDIKTLSIHKNIIENFLDGKSEEIEKISFINKNLVIDTLIKIKEIKFKYIHDTNKNINIYYDLMNTFPFVRIYNSKENIINFMQLETIFKNQKYLYEFLEYIYSEDFEHKSFIENVENKISLITIHKSKGLQYDTVIYLANNSRSNNDNRNIFFFKMDEKFENVIDSIFCNSRYKIVLDRIYQNDSVKEYDRKIEEEKINNLYVATTRAKNNLFIVSNEDYFEEFEVGTFKQKKYITNSETENYDSILIDNFCNKNDETETDRLPLDSATLLHNFNSKLQISTENKRIKGLVIHYFLENLNSPSQKDIDIAKKLCLKKFSSNFSDEVLKNEILSDKNIEIVLNKIRDTKIFEEEWTHSYNEYQLYDRDNNVKVRLDKLLIKCDENSKITKILIVDYKTGNYSEEQLRNYKEILSKKLKVIDENLDAEKIIETLYISI